MGKWLGKTINPLGTYRGIYFNKSFDIGEVFKLLKQLPYKEIHGAPAYTIFNGKDSNENYVLVLAIYESQSKWYEIHITKRYNGETKMYNIRPSSLENEYFDFGFEVTGTLDAEDYNNGEEKYNDLIKTYVSAVPIRYDNSFAIQMHPINEDGSLDKTINLFPKTRLSAIEDGDGNPVEETELELSDSEPSANAKDLKKILLNGEEWKVTGSGGGGETLVLNIPYAAIDTPVSVDDATHQKIMDNKITKVRVNLTMPQGGGNMAFTIDFQKSTLITMEGQSAITFHGWVNFAYQTLMVLGYNPEEKTFSLTNQYDFINHGNLNWYDANSTSGDSVVGGTTALTVDGNLVFRIPVDHQNLNNDNNLCTSKAVKAYVDSKIAESVTIALSDDYTIGG